MQCENPGCNKEAQIHCRIQGDNEEQLCTPCARDAGYCIHCGEYITENNAGRAEDSCIQCEYEIGQAGSPENFNLFDDSIMAW